MKIRHLLQLMGDLAWLIPLLVIMAIPALLITAANVAAPFVYTIF